jgi:hypothetical protein
MGSAIFATILGGQARVQAVLEQHDLTRGAAPRLMLAYPVAIFVGIACGITLGTVFGPVHSVGALLGTAYGITMLTAFILVVVALVFGPATPASFKPAWAARIKLGEACILGAFTCMMLLRVGL